MSFLILPSRKTVLSLGDYELNSGNPINRGVLSLVADRGPVKRDLVSHAQASRSFPQDTRTTGVLNYVGTEYFGGWDSSPIGVSGLTEGTLFTVAIRPGAQSPGFGGPSAITQVGETNRAMSMEPGIFFSAWSSTNSRFNINASGFTLTPLGVVQTLALTVKNSTMNAYINGRLVGSGSGPATLMTFHNLFSGSNGGGFWGCIVPINGAWARALTDLEIRSISDDPSQLVQARTQRPFFFDMGAGGGPTNYSLTADVGGYALTGIDATLTYTAAPVNYSLTADVGSYALTGVDATLTYIVAGTAYTLSADAGSYSLTGVDATLNYVPGSGAYTLTAETGSYSLTGNDAGLTFARSMTADVGSYTLAGTDAGLQLGRRLTADTGVYSLAGSDAVLTYTSTAPIAYTLACEPGAYLLNGSDARFLVNGVGEAGEHGFVLVDMPSTMWWKRKPKAITEEVAKKKIKRVVRAIQEVAQEQAAEPAKAAQSTVQQQREVYQAIAPLLAEMPGFDWKQVFRQIVAQDTARRQMEAAIARARFIEQDDEDVILLMMT